MGIPSKAQDSDPEYQILGIVYTDRTIHLSSNRIQWLGNPSQCHSLSILVHLSDAHLEVPAVGGMI